MLLDILTYNIHGLPWSRDFTQGICEFLIQKLPSIICLQEVFHSVNRKFYKDFLTMVGYEVCLPRDEDVTLLPSGLLTAFKKSEFTVLSDCFCCFQNFHNVEWFANKGFHSIRVYQHATKKVLRIVNTHTQSDTFVSWFFGKKVIADIRRNQAKQMYNFFKAVKEPVLIIGDLNCEEEPYEALRFLHPVGVPASLKKRTFYSTGEDLDHIAYLKNFLQPELIRCRIYDQPWSDHAPVRFTVKI